MLSSQIPDLVTSSNSLVDDEGLMILLNDYYKMTSNNANLQLSDDINRCWYLGK